MMKTALVIGLILVCLIGASYGDWLNGNPTNYANQSYASFGWLSQLTNGVDVVLTNTFLRPIYLKRAYFVTQGTQTNSFMIRTTLGTNDLTVYSNEVESLMWNLAGDGVKIETNGVTTFSTDGTNANSLYYEIMR